MIRRCWEWEPTDVVGFVPDSSLVTGTKTIDLIPGFFIRKGDLIWGQSYDLPILLVELPLALDKLAS